jgi:hypothetical protein
VVIGRSRRGKTRSRQAAAPWAEGLRPIPSSQPENKNSPRQLESEAGLTPGIPRRFRALGAAALPQSENHVGQQQCVAFVLRHIVFRKQGFSQINVTTHRRSASSTRASREPQLASIVGSSTRRQTVPLPGSAVPCFVSVCACACASETQWKQPWPGGYTEQRTWRQGELIKLATTLLERSMQKSSEQR